MSLHDKSLLISLALAGIPSTRQDKEITRDVLFQQQADADAGRWMSRLWPRPAMEPIRAIDGQIRAYHYSKTLPWMDKGERIIASRIFTAYMEHIRELRYKRETLVQGFIDSYDDWIEQARLMRGALFKPEEYPHRLEAARRFRFEISATPVPHKEDFRVSLASEEMQEIQASLDARVQQAELTATRDLYRRIAAPVAALVERLAKPDSRLTEATLNSLRDLVATLPDINVFDDLAVESLRQSIQSHLCPLHLDTLTESRSDRSRALEKANSILATMAPWMEADSSDLSNPSEHPAAA